MNLTAADSGISADPVRSFMKGTLQKIPGECYIIGRL
jgi:hypothetical protein